MNFFKRIIISILRQKKKTFVLFLVTLVLATIMCGSAFIGNVGNMIKYQTIEKLGAEVYINGEINQSDNPLNDRYYNELKEYYVVLDEYGKNKLVSAYDSELFSEIKMSSTISYNNSSIDLTNQENDYYWTTYLGGVRNKDLVGQIKGDLEITSGRTFSNEEMSSGKFVAIIPDNYIYYENGEKREIQIGQNIPIFIENQKEKKSFNLEVIGKYKIIKDPNETCSSYSCMIFPIYVPIDCSKTVIEKDYALGNQVNVFTLGGYYKLNQVNKISDFIGEIQNDFKKIDDEYTITSSINTYEKIAKSIEEIVILTDNISLATSLFVCVVLVLIALIFYRTRTHEIGIYCALGQRKRITVLQFGCEIILIGSVSILITIFIYSLFKDLFMQILITKFMNAANNPLIEQSILSNEYLELFNEKALINMVRNYFIVLILANILPMIYIVKLKTNQILSNH